MSSPKTQIEAIVSPPPVTPIPRRKSSRLPPTPYEDHTFLGSQELQDQRAYSQEAMTNNSKDGDGAAEDEKNTLDDELVKPDETAGFDNSSPPEADQRHLPDLPRDKSYHSPNLPIGETSHSANLPTGEKSHSTKQPNELELLAGYSQNLSPHTEEHSTNNTLGTKNAHSAAKVPRDVVEHLKDDTLPKVSASEHSPETVSQPISKRTRRSQRLPPTPETPYRFVPLSGEQIMENACPEPHTGDAESSTEQPLQEMKLPRRTMKECSGDKELAFKPAKEAAPSPRITRRRSKRQLSHLPLPDSQSVQRQGNLKQLSSVHAGSVSHEDENLEQPERAPEIGDIGIKKVDATLGQTKLVLDMVNLPEEITPTMTSQITTMADKITAGTAHNTSQAAANQNMTPNEEDRMTEEQCSAVDQTARIGPENAIHRKEQAATVQRPTALYYSQMMLDKASPMEEQSNTKLGQGPREETRHEPQSEQSLTSNKSVQKNSKHTKSKQNSRKTSSDPKMPSPKITQRRSKRLSAQNQKLLDHRDSQILSPQKPYQEATASLGPEIGTTFEPAHKHKYNQNRSQTMEASDNRVLEKSNLARSHQDKSNQTILPNAMSGQSKVISTMRLDSGHRVVKITPKDQLKKDTQFFKNVTKLVESAKSTTKADRSLGKHKAKKSKKSGKVLELTNSRNVRRRSRRLLGKVDEPPRLDKSNEVVMREMCTASSNSDPEQCSVYTKPSPSSIQIVMKSPDSRRSPQDRKSIIATKERVGIDEHLSNQISKGPHYVANTTSSGQSSPAKICSDEDFELFKTIQESSLHQLPEKLPQMTESSPSNENDLVCVRQGGSYGSQCSQQSLHQLGQAIEKNSPVQKELLQSHSDMIISEDFQGTNMDTTSDSDSDASTIAVNKRRRHTMRLCDSSESSTSLSQDDRSSVPSVSSRPKAPQLNSKSYLSHSHQITPTSSVNRSVISTYHSHEPMSAVFARKPLPVLESDSSSSQHGDDIPLTTRNLNKAKNLSELNSKAEPYKYKSKARLKTKKREPAKSVKKYMQKEEQVNQESDLEELIIATPCAFKLTQESIDLAPGKLNDLESQPVKLTPVELCLNLGRKNPSDPRSSTAPDGPSEIVAETSSKSHQGPCQYEQPSRMLEAPIPTEIVIVNQGKLSIHEVENPPCETIQEEPVVRRTCSSRLKKSGVSKISKAKLEPEEVTWIASDQEILKPGKPKFKTKKKADLNTTYTLKFHHETSMSQTIEPSDASQGNNSNHKDDKSLVNEVSMIECPELKSSTVVGNASVKSDGLEDEVEPFTSTHVLPPKRFGLKKSISVGRLENEAITSECVSTSKIIVTKLEKPLRPASTKKSPASDLNTSEIVVSKLEQLTRSAPSEKSSTPDLTPEDHVNSDNEASFISQKRLLPSRENSLYISMHQFSSDTESSQAELSQVKQQFESANKKLETTKLSYAELLLSQSAESVAVDSQGRPFVPDSGCSTQMLHTEINSQGRPFVPDSGCNAKVPHAEVDKQGRAFVSDTDSSEVSLVKDEPVSNDILRPSHSDRCSKMIETTETTPSEPDRDVMDMTTDLSSLEDQSRDSPSPSPIRADMNEKIADTCPDTKTEKALLRIPLTESARDITEFDHQLASNELESGHDLPTDPLITLSLNDSPTESALQTPKSPTTKKAVSFSDEKSGKSLATMTPKTRGSALLAMFDSSPEVSTPNVKKTAKSILKRTASQKCDKQQPDSR